MRRMAQRKRTKAQVDAEARREATDELGKVLVRHTPESAAALRKLQRRQPHASAPELYRTALVELAKRG